MSRPIKFRAWNPILKKWERKPGEYALESLTDGEFVLCQFTGLRDKNGEEIYEGDIVHVYWMACLGVCEPEFDRNAVVKWGDCMWIADLISKVRHCACEDGSYDEDFIALTELSHDEEVNLEFEVIGNIHQNPELLEAKE